MDIIYTFIIEVICMQYYLVSKVNDKLVFSEDDKHHIRDVMRFKDGDEVYCVCDKKQYLTRLSFVNNDIVPVIIKEDDVKRELDVDVTLIVGLPRSEKFELIIQKATELGVSRIVPFISKRSIIKLDKDRGDKKVSRWQKIAKEAMEQSRRCVCPEVTPIISEKEVKNYMSSTNIIAYEESKETTLKSLMEQENKSITFIVGPEGGFDESEVKYFTSLGFNSVSLGNRILRCETACFYLLTLASFYYN